jgi:ribosome-associated protein
MNQAQTPPSAPLAAGPALNPAPAPLPGSAGALLADVEPGSLLALVLTSLDDDQAQEVVNIPLAGKSSMADYMIIASGRSTRQVASMAQKLAERVKKGGFGWVRIEGLPAADWVLIDAGDIIVHLFRPEVRSFYNLERMWGFGTDAPAAA